MNTLPATGIERGIQATGQPDPIGDAPGHRSGGIAQFALPTKAHIWMNEMTMRAVKLPGIRHLVQRAVRSSS